MAMMRYSPEHKNETRKMVMRAAAAALRAHGPDGVGVAEIMRGVGLTHGGFYAHFRSKEDLIAQAVTQMFANAKRRFERFTAGLPPAEALGAYIDLYVSIAHRDDAARGCPLTSMAADLARGSGTARFAFDEGVHGILRRLAEWLPPVDGISTRARAASLLAEMAGAVALSRAVQDPSLSGDLLQYSRAAVRARAGLPPEQGASP